MKVLSTSTLCGFFEGQFESCLTRIWRLLEIFLWTWSRRCCLKLLFGSWKASKKAYHEISNSTAGFLWFPVIPFSTESNGGTLGSLQISMPSNREPPSPLPLPLAHVLCGSLEIFLPWQKAREQRRVMRHYARSWRRAIQYTPLEPAKNLEWCAPSKIWHEY